MTHRRRISLLLLSAAIISLDASAEDKLGRLFLTPQRRAALEQQRQLNLQEQQSLQGSTMSLDGVVVRSSGKKTVWINGRSQNDNNNDLGVTANVKLGDAAHAGLMAGNEQAADLRVGQKINRATREIKDGLEGGKLIVKPPSQRQ